MFDENFPLASRTLADASFPKPTSRAEASQHDRALKRVAVLIAVIPQSLFAPQPHLNCPAPFR